MTGMDDTTQTRAEPRRTGFLLAIVAGLVGILVGAGAVYAIDHRRGSSTPAVAKSPIPETGANQAAIVRCTRALDAKLLAPTRPKYHDIQTTVDVGKPSVVLLKGTVDVMNRSGGYSTLTWSCHYRDDKADATITGQSPAPVPTSAPT